LQQVNPLTGYGLNFVIAPEPNAAVLLISGLLGFAGWRRVRAPSADLGRKKVVKLVLRSL
jgi:hypothetical protein